MCWSSKLQRKTFGICISFEQRDLTGTLACLRREVQRRHDPCNNDLLPYRFAEWPPGSAKLSPSHCNVTKPPAILSPHPAFWSLLVIFIFCLVLLASPKKYQNISLHSKLCHSLKNNLINKFDILIYSIDLKLYFCKVYIKMDWVKDDLYKRLI